MKPFQRDRAFRFPGSLVMDDRYHIGFRIHIRRQQIPVKIQGRKAGSTGGNLHLNFPGVIHKGRAVPLFLLPDNRPMVIIEHMGGIPVRNGGQLRILVVKSGKQGVQAVLQSIHPHCHSGPGQAEAQNHCCGFSAGCIQNPVVPQLPAQKKPLHFSIKPRGRLRLRHFLQSFLCKLQFRHADFRQLLFQIFFRKFSQFVHPLSYAAAIYW